MHTFQGFPINDGDKLFVVGQGPAKVIEARQQYFRVLVNGRTRKISYDGIMSGDKYPSVFWANPIIVNPAKDNQLWSQQRQICLTLMQSYSNVIAHQPRLELADEIEVIEDETASTPQQNDNRLREIVAEAHARQADTDARLVARRGGAVAEAS